MFATIGPTLSRGAAHDEASFSLSPVKQSTPPREDAETGGPAWYLGTTIQIKGVRCLLAGAGITYASDKSGEDYPGPWFTPVLFVIPDNGPVYITSHQ